MNNYLKKQTKKAKVKTYSRLIITLLAFFNLCRFVRQLCGNLNYKITDHSFINKLIDLKK